MNAIRTSKTRARVITIEHGVRRDRPDQLATEEPLEIRLLAAGQRRTLAVTMRTPGADFELAAGFLYGEGVVRSQAEIARISYCVDRELNEEQRFNTVNVQLFADRMPDIAALERHFYTSSACGVCGKASIEALQLGTPAELPAGPHISSVQLFQLPEMLRSEQQLFSSTGGLHAAALFALEPDGTPQLVALREDVGRHNALDKLIGWALLDGRLPLHTMAVLVSGRTSYEIMQKCLVAGIPIVCSVSAPSSLAVDIAHTYGMTLVGFLRGQRCNIYAGAQRIDG